MSWVFLSLIARTFWGLTNIGEKYLVDKKFQNPFVYMILGFFVGLVGLLVLPFTDLFLPSWQIVVWLFLAACGFFFGTIFYLKAIQMEEVSRINVLWNFVPIFALLGSGIFIGEKLNLVEFIAFIFLISGGIFASVHAKGGKKYNFSSAFFIMVLACLGFATTDIINRYVANSGLPFLKIFLWNSLFLVFLSIIYLIFSKKIRRDFLAEKSSYLSIKVLGIILAVNFISRAGSLFNVWAVSLGPVALVDAMEGFQVFFVFLLATIFTIYIPNVIKEEIDKKNILIKLGSFVLMLVGVFILAFK